MNSKNYKLLVVGLILVLLCGCANNSLNKNTNSEEVNASKNNENISINSDIDGEYVKKDKIELGEVDNTMKDDKSMLETGIEWEENSITVYEPYNGGVWYPRMYELKNGTILCGFDTNEDGGRAVIKIVSSEDGGLTWSENATQGTNYSEYDCANANFIELENGDIWLSYRANVVDGDDYYSSIRVNVSKDGGNTWQPHSIVAEEKGKGGVYEPHFGYIGDKIAVFYANDSLNVVNNGRQQNIEFKLWEEDSWGEKRIASDGTKTFSRDGMPVFCQLENNSYAMVIESTSLHPSYEFIIQMKTSTDGLDWSEKLRNIYVPSKISKKAGAPYIVKLTNGRIAVSFQTDEDAVNTGDAFSTMKVMISSDDTGNEFLPATLPFDTPEGYCSNWNGLLNYHEYLLAVTSTNYPSDMILLKRGKLK